MYIHIYFLFASIENLLHLFERYQQTWTFLTKMFREGFSTSKVDWVSASHRKLSSRSNSESHIFSFLGSTISTS